MVTTFYTENGLLRFNINGRAKDHHLTGGPLNPKTRTWRYDDALVLRQILNSMEPCVQDLILHYRTIKKMWNYLDILYSGDNNPSWAYNVIQELFRSKQKNLTLAQFYADFNKLFEEIREIFPITTDVKEIQERWNKLVILIFLGSLR